jgi:hypothetical protein
MTTFLRDLTRVAKIGLFRWLDFLGLGWLTSADGKVSFTKLAWVAVFILTADILHDLDPAGVASNLAANMAAISFLLIALLAASHMLRGLMAFFAWKRSAMNLGADELDRPIATVDDTSQFPVQTPPPPP